MDFFGKSSVMIASILMIIITGSIINDKRRCSIVMTLFVLIFISAAINKSILGIIYWDGPYSGRVVDADTGAPIEGANVAGIWEFEYYYLQSFRGIANARETVTNANGEFKLPLTLAFSLWPLAVISRMNLVVFKPGYDSHPPRISRKMPQPKDLRQTASGIYHVGRRVQWSTKREGEVRLNKALTVEERREATGEGNSNLRIMGVNQSKVKKFLEAIDREYIELKKMRKQN